MWAAVDRAKRWTAPGPDGIPYEVYKNIHNLALTILLDTFNLVWPSCQLSESWLWAAIVPIPKPEKAPQELRNLRPIALTSTLCTLLERILATRLRWWIDTLHWYRPAQIGFRPHPGTEHGLEYLSFMVFVGGHSRHVRPVQGVCKNICMDICKACDNVSHAAILQVLCCPDIFFNTVQSFCMRINGGSLARLLESTAYHKAVSVSAAFNIVLQAWPFSTIQGLYFLMYADDITVCTVGPDLSRQAECLQQASSDCQKWWSMRASPY